jgi:protein-L-isoaspartate(D-aspartate) O-methyltransferase
MVHFSPDKFKLVGDLVVTFPPLTVDDDTPEDRRQRDQMIHQQIIARSVTNPRVLGAMAAVPRHLFLTSRQQSEAYTDQALPVAHQQTISQPYIVAYMSEQLEVKPEHRVLEIGTGTGYQTAILALLAREVYTVERIEALSAGARTVLDGLGFINIFYRIDDGSCGWPEHAPFDRILVTAASSSVPQPLLDQICDGGKLVIPIGTRDLQMLTAIERRGDQFRSVDLLTCRFVPLISRQNSSGSGA